ncbi:uncharacterized protein HMPREF1541_05830 [Cyphellophora europaea CBS 101466]|uniref:ASST-domain-containing protein n=1 Tax=Cyphellophora europaea (strain CBS 101466) TaxID=1220924 RepID=W2RV69_CYPE1|nr:uncharacterized protein HMPREF1541_05830 [Cyphellophora europaea CBS 101466]ETN39604.1 hypothetical protein HMPREF1541_05830 [Cyphellophora europaea CBS 101466]
MARSLLSLIPAAAALVSVVQAQAQDEAYHSFQSICAHRIEQRPDLRPPILTVNVSEDSVEPGYIFMAPYRTDTSQNSAVIYDTEGNVIWTSFPQTAQNVVYDFRPCEYNETSHLCMLEGQQYLGYARGYVSVFDESLTQVRQVKAQNGHAALDQHETALSYDKKATLTMIYNTERADLSAQNITTGMGWLQNCIFQKLDIETNDLLFEWSAIEHVSLQEAHVFPNTTEVVGSGLVASSPWDYFHINSMDENADGDYLISARHTSSLYKLSGTSGDVLWRLGGSRSDFELLDSFNFSSQHDARWHASNTTHDIISLFDNASNGFNRSANHSQGMIVALDHQADPPTARLLSAFAAPDDIPISDSQGNMQLLSPGEEWETSNAFINWGNVPVVTEHSPDGRIIFRASVEIDPNGMMNYRAYKVNTANLTLLPNDTPALYTYARTTDSDTVYYMSWNGATEIARWRIYGRNACDDEWVSVDTVDKAGFETTYRADQYFEFGMVEAVFGNDTGIRNSTIKGVRTFVPGPLLSQNCDDEGCQDTEEYNVPEDGAQVAMEVAQLREACPATPQELQEERDRVEEMRGGGAEGDEEDAASRGVVSWMLVLAAVLGSSWVLA